MKCFDCGTVIEFGEFYYSKITKRRGGNFIKKSKIQKFEFSSIFF